VSKSWKRLLESSHKLWTTFDTRSTRKSVSLTALKLHLRRSNYSLDKAVISTKAKFDVPRMQYLTRTCHKLKYLEICGSGVIGDSLTAALPQAKSLETIVCGTRCEISLAAVQSVLKICQKTLLEATFLRVKGNRIGFLSNQWPELRSLRTLNLRSSGDMILDLVSVLLSTSHFKAIFTCLHW
jgi:F-box/TPR repeat protein Pof3